MQTIWTIKVYLQSQGFQIIFPGNNVTNAGIYDLWLGSFKNKMPLLH